MYQSVKNDFDNVIRHSQSIEEPKTDKLFAEWATKKQRFIEAFGGLIYEYPEKVQFELSEQAKKEKFDYFLDYIYYHYYGNKEAGDFIKEQGMDAFFNNLTEKDYITSNGKEIKKGTKLLKALKHLIDNSNVLSAIQNKASQIIQENKIEGTLCLSVHPLDYLSSSETTYNWRSCHSLDGEYRAGNLSYMMDDCTFLCYLKGDKDEKLPNFPDDVPWNSKKWRVLLFLSSDGNMIFAGKQYPFETKGGLDFVLDKVLSRTMPSSASSYSRAWSKWNNCIYPEVEVYDDYILQLKVPYVPIDEKLFPLKEIVKDVRGSKHFNDLLSSSTYKPLYSVRVVTYSFGQPEILSRIGRTEFNIGGKTMCLFCGEQEVYGGAETMMCEHCELEYGSIENDLVGYCAVCDRRMFTDDAYYVEGEMICADCYEDETIICEGCGESYYRHGEHTRYDEETDTYYCSWCYNDLLDERERQKKEEYFEDNEEVA